MIVTIAAALGAALRRSARNASRMKKKRRPISSLAVRVAVGVDSISSAHPDSANSVVDSSW